MQLRRFFHQQVSAGRQGLEQEMVLARIPDIAQSKPQQDEANMQRAKVTPGSAHGSSL